MTMDASPQPAAEQAASSPNEGDFNIDVPSMGESITEATVIEWLKNVGDSVMEDEVMCQLETDKVTVDVRAPRRGTIVEVMANAGDTVYVGNPLLKMSAKAGAAAAVATPAKKPEAAAAAPGKKPLPAPEALKKAPADLPPLPKMDTVKAPSSQLYPEPVAPQINVSQSGDRRVQMTRMRRRIAERLKEAQNTAAMLTTFNEIDMTALIAMRNDFKDQFAKKHGVKLGFMSAFVKAAATALIEQPEVNAVIDGNDIVYRDYVDISVAVSTPTGLVVPVLRSCENMSFAQIEKTINSLGERAKTGQITLEEMQGGTFTISNGGVFGSLLSTPILNMPQSAILGMHIIQNRPMVVDDKIVIRPMMYIALSYDHRLIDGREAVSFLRRIKTLIEDPRRLLLDVDN